MAAVTCYRHLHLSKDTENANIGTGDSGLGAMKGDLIFFSIPSAVLTFFDPVSGTLF